MELDEAILGRRATRQYTLEKVDQATLKRLIDAAVQAPSAVNQQPWAFTVVRDQGILDRVSKDAKSHLTVAMPAPTDPDRVHGHLTDPNFHIFYHAPALILISATAQKPWIVEDCSLAAENLMLSAHGSGLGSCWIGLAQGFLNTAAGKQALDIPPDWIAVAPIIVGHPSVKPAPVPRKEPLVRWLG